MMRNTMEIDAILIELNKSIDAHYKWLVNMFRCAVTSNATQPDIMGDNAHFVCQFGQWLNNQSLRNEDDCSYVNKINTVHEKCIYQARICYWQYWRNGVIHGISPNSRTRYWHLRLL